jgi:hypothetical protein
MNLNLIQSSAQVTQGLIATTDFKRELDNYNWAYKSEGNWKFLNTDFGYRSQLNSRMFLFNKIPQNVQDETQVAIWAQQKLTTQWFLFSDTDYYSFTNTDITSMQSHFGLGFQGQEFTIKPSLGWYSDTRSNRTDDGLQYGVQATTKTIRIDDDLQTKLNAQLHYADISPRRFQSSSIQSTSLYQTQEVQLRVTGLYSFNERDSYQPSSFFNRNITDIIEKIISDTTRFQVGFSTQVNEVFRFNFSGFSLYNIRNFENKPLTDDTENSIIDTRYTRQELEGTGSIDYSFAFGQGQLGLRYAVSGLDARITKALNSTDEEITRRNDQLRNTFYDQETTELFAKNSISINQNHTINTNATLSILRFDTPETNFDDRDELFSALEIEHRFNSNHTYETSLLVSGESYHRVFLFKQRSLENNKRQSLRLQPSMIWFPLKRIRWSNQFMVRANYTVYDFQDREGTVRDQSSREWGFTSDIRWEFAKNWFSSLLVSRNRLIIGQLFWNEFSETPIDTLTTTRIESAIELQKMGLYAKLGIRVFIKDDYIPITVLQLNQNDATLTRFTTGNQQTFQFGPMLSLRWESTKYGEISLDGWLQLQYLRNQWYIEVPDTFNRALNTDERFRRTRIFPNLSIRTKFYL